MILFSYYFYWFIKLLELTVVNKYTYTAHQTRLQARHQLLYLNMGNVSYIISFAVLLVWTIKKITNHRCLRGKHNKKINIGMCTQYANRNQIKNRILQCDIRSCLRLSIVFLTLKQVLVIMHLKIWRYFNFYGTARGKLRPFHDVGYRMVT